MSDAPMGYQQITVPEDRLAELIAVEEMAFAEVIDAETQAAAPFAVPWDRARGMQTEAGELVAVHGSYPFTLPVPGGAVACAGLTYVGVRPDHRRRGLLSAMIASHLERSLARGEVVSALFAAEPGIYGRFGYGSAADNLRLTVPRGARLRDVPGSAGLTVRFEPLTSEHADLVAAVQAEAGRGRPGWVLRPTELMRRSAVADPPAWRGGGEPARLVTVLDAAGAPRAYAVLHRSDTWVDGNPACVARVAKSAAVDAAAAHRLWSFLLDLDLTASVSTGLLPVDDALAALLVDARRAVPKTTDNLWVRLLDVPAALAGRRYAAPVDLRIDVRDAALPANAGTWRLVTGPADADGTCPARVERVAGVDDDRAAADLVLDVRELGAAYLGGRSLRALAEAGLVEARTPAALHAATTAFGWPLAPVCPWIF
ncbi:MAG TPA: GNAT family N-acetyltransferase [Cellulomonas sp.]